MSTKELIIKFLANGAITSNDNFIFCESRDQSAARLPKWMKAFQSYGVREGDAAILTAILGELTNNAFDHNLGQWHEPSGCAVAFEKYSDDHLDIFVADRGQGIVSSLGKSLDENLKPDLILKKAFEERVSGRAPERRGNGLKFVLKYIQSSNSSLVCASQSALYTSGQALSLDATKLPSEFGTLIWIRWSIH